MKKLSAPLILLDGKPKTLQIETIRSTDSGVYEVYFKGRETVYTYRKSKVKYLTKPKWLPPDLSFILRNGSALNNIVDIFEFRSTDSVYWRIKFANGTIREYSDQEARVIKSCLSTDLARSVFDYLSKVASINSLGREDGQSSLLSQIYSGIKYIDETTAAACYINPAEYKAGHLKHTGALIYPFGCNASQKKAVAAAFERQISVVEGPPGTGKTQTILNIIANIISAGKSVIVVSNNNSAILNVQDKLEKYDCAFIVASLGSRKNKQTFIEQQQDIPESLNTWACTRDERTASEHKLLEVHKRLDRMFSLKNDLAGLYQEQSALKLEWKHFAIEHGFDLDLKPTRRIRSDKFLAYWLKLQAKYEQTATTSPKV